VLMRGGVAVPSAEEAFAIECSQRCRARRVPAALSSGLRLSRPRCALCSWCCWWRGWCHPPEARHACKSMHVCDTLDVLFRKLVSLQILASGIASEDRVLLTGFTSCPVGGYLAASCRRHSPFPDALAIALEERREHLSDLGSGARFGRN